MQKNLILPANSSSMLFGMVLYFLIACSQTSCTHHDKEKAPVRNWITLNIKFKANATAEGRGMTILTIEKLLIDSLKVLRAGTYSNYFPVISVSTVPFGDTLQYDINVGPGENSVMIQSLAVFPGGTIANDSTSKPVCSCTLNNCGVCEIMKRNVASPPTGNPEYQNIDSISFPIPELDLQH
jgi:hypothetical protein